MQTHPALCRRICSTSWIWAGRFESWITAIYMSLAVIMKNWCSLTLFFASYFDAPLNENDIEAFFRGISYMRYTSMRSKLNEYSVEILDRQRKKKVTIQNEILRSQQEVDIANFLYRNGIEYEYEPVYRYHIEMAKKPYTPDFVLRQGDREIYLEHFGITRDGQNTRYDAARLQTYKDAVNEKILLHRRHGTELIYTFSGYGDGRSLTEHLEEELRKHGVVFHPRSEKEILQKILQEEGSRYVRRLVELISRFISNFKVDGYTEMQFSIMKEKTDNVRTQLFLDIAGSFIQKNPSQIVKTLHSDKRIVDPVLIYGMAGIPAENAL